MLKGFRMRKTRVNCCCAVDAFERNKFLSYLCEFLNKKQNLKTYLLKICEWYEESGREYFAFEWLNIQENESYGGIFANFYHAHKREALRRGEAFLRKAQEKLQTSKIRKVSSLENKLNLISELFRLNEKEKEIMGLYIRLKLNQAMENFLYTVLGHRAEKISLPFYFLPYAESTDGSLLNHNGKLYLCGLLDVDYEGDICASSRAFRTLGQQFSNVQELREIILNKPLTTNLKWKDFSHINEKDFCAQLLKGAISSRSKGINILLYGEPGTGKTEFAKALCQKVKGRLYAVGETSSEHRMEELCMLQEVVARDKGTCLLIDEADDLMDEKKIRVNRALENNYTPCIWIVNSIRFWDKAYLRRFTYAIDFKSPNLETRTQIWRKTFKQYNMTISLKKAKELATEYNLTPAFVANAVQSAKLVKGGVNEACKSLKAMEKAYNNGREKMKSKPKKEDKKTLDFNPALLNTDTDLQKLSEQVKNLKCRNFSLCLYGVSGTGKSAYAEYLAEQLGMPVLKKRASDLLSMWHGETEHNIASAFAEAKDKKALLIFDEADSFLQDRQHSYHSWEVTQVNEMLTQMEKHELPFVCTTNLMDNLDKASLRRFTFKVEYKYMKPEQNTLAFEHFFGIKNVDLSHISSMTPGDFVVVKQKAEIMGYQDNKEELIKMLEQEQKQKAPVTRRIGFC